MNNIVSKEDLFDKLAAVAATETWTMEAAKVGVAPRRFEVGFYASEGYRAVEAMTASGFDIETVGENADVNWPGVFARRFVHDKEHGIPFLTTSTMMEARPRPTSFLSKVNTRNLDNYLVDENTILISRSGTVGNVCITPKDRAGWAVTEDAIRVIVQDDSDLGPVYCYLQSPLGQFLVKKSQTGSVVRHIYEADVTTLPIPRLPKRLRRELTDLIKKASALRVEANKLLDEAEEMVYQNSGILPKKQSQAEEHETYICKNLSLVDRTKEEGYARLDSKYHNPTDLNIRAAIKNTSQWVFLGDVADITLIGKTFVPGVNKVEEEHGLPYFTGKELFRARIIPDTWITSKKKKDIDKLIVRKGVTLITCAGTAGRVAYVGDQLEGTTVTHDAMRIQSNRSVHGGYIYAFLASVLGKAQLMRATYGSVHSRLHDSLLKKFVIFIPSDNGKSIGKLVDRAASLQDKATQTEHQSIQMFLQAIKYGRKKTEAEWGVEY